MENTNTDGSSNDLSDQQTYQQPISPISATTTTAGSIPTLPPHVESHLTTPHTATTTTTNDAQLSNLAASSINTIEIHAKLAMSATSHDTSLSDILADTPVGGGANAGIIRELPAFSNAGERNQKALRPSPRGEEEEKMQLQRVRGLLLQSGGGVERKECGGKSLSQDEEEMQDGTEKQELDDQKQQPKQKLTISTSTISLALSTTLSTPAYTPLSPGTSARPPTHPIVDELTSLKRQRSLSIQETEAILLGSGEDDSEEEEAEKPKAKKSRVEKGDVFVAATQCSEPGMVKNGDVASGETKQKQPNVFGQNADQNDETVPLTEKNAGEDQVAEEEEKKEDVETSTSEGATWSVRQNLGVRGPDQRWRAHQIAEDYISLASSITLPPTYLGPFGYSPTTGQYPIEQVTALGYLTSPLRRPTIIEKWSPYEIVTFEAAITLHGKQFHQIQKWVKTKSTKEIVEFYYIWKKTSHYQRWKNQYEEEIESDGSEEGDGKGKGGVSGARLPTSPARRGRR